VSESESLAQSILDAFPLFGSPVSDGTVIRVTFTRDSLGGVIGATGVAVKFDDADDQSTDQMCDWSGAFNAAIIAGQVTAGTRVKVLNGSAFILDRVIVGAKFNG
jgi:hypothetical protein